MSLIVQGFVKASLKNNNYIVADSEKKEAILIDCSCPDDEIINWLNQNGLVLKYILLTHGHFDHVAGVNYYQDQWGIDAYLYEKDYSLLSYFEKYAQLARQKVGEQPQHIKNFDLNATFHVGRYPIEIIPTPGHTQGGVCYLIEGNLFSGDTLFHGTYGRTDLDESDEQAMQKSLQNLFQKLPDETPVYPGHGATTTIGHERSLYQ